ncbi:unnamed protein product [Discosporangium mesarthrocarpum]
MITTDLWFILPTQCPFLSRGLVTDAIYQGSLLETNECCTPLRFFCPGPAHPATQINFLLLISRQGKTRLTKWYNTYTAKEKARIVREVTSTVLARAPKMCNFVEWRDKKIVYKRQARSYASLFFVACINKDDNELITLEQIHLFVEVLDRYFGNVCELDIIFNFHKAYYILDELFIGGELQESSKKEVLRLCSQMDELMEEAKEETSAGVSSTVRRR